jgi:hypothetical protein
MDTTTALPARPPAGPEPQDLALPPPAGSAQPVRSLDCGAGMVELRVLQGRVWLTCEGRPEDHFIDAGQTLRLRGPARLHLSAEGRRGARVALARAGE